MNRNDFSNKAASGICTDRLVCCQLDDALLSEISGGNGEIVKKKDDPEERKAHFCPNCNKKFYNPHDLRHHICLVYHA